MAMEFCVTIVGFFYFSFSFVTVLVVAHGNI